MTKLARGPTASLGAALTGAAAVAAAAAAAAAAVAMRSRLLTPQVSAAPTPWNQALLSLCPSLAAPYSLPALLSNGHVETIYAAFFRRRPHILYDREILHLPDGGCVALDTEDVDKLPADMVGAVGEEVATSGPARLERPSLWKSLRWAARVD